MDKLSSDCKEIGTTDATKCLVVGNRVFDPAVFSPRLFQFTRKEYLFLNAYRIGVPLEEAAEKSEMSVATAERFLTRQSTIQWLEDRALKDHIRNEWNEPGKWWELGDRVLNGEKELSKAQIVVFQEFGHRVCPKAKDPESGAKAGPTINFNFSPEAVQEAFRRQEAIDGEIVKQNADE